MHKTARRIPRERSNSSWCARNGLPALGPALVHFQAAVSINPDLDEAKLAQQNITTIQKALQPH